MEKTAMTNVLVIDTSERSLPTFVASATQVGNSSRLVLRHAADGPSLERISISGIPNTTMPVLLVGGGYKAQSSEGFVRVNADGPSQEVWVVGAAGCLGANALRALGVAQRAVLLPPSSIMKGVCRGGKTNRQVKEAVEAAASLFGKVARVTTLMEGQSNRADTFIFKPVEGWSWPEFHSEHQERFGDKQLFEAALNDRANYLARLGQMEEMPEEVKALRRTAFKMGVSVVHKAWLDALQSADHQTTYQRLESGRPILTLRGASHGAVANLCQQLADKRAELEELGWKAEFRGYGDLFVFNAEKSAEFNVGDMYVETIYEDAIKAHLRVETIVKTSEEVA